MDNIRNYFVDESGDVTLFDKRGRKIIGENGCSKTFMIGLIYFRDPVLAQKKVSELRASLLANPSFNTFPSMQPQAKKTALLFHAKNDIAQVRQEVFNLLPTLEAKVLVVIRRKCDLAEKSRFLHNNTGENEQLNSIYDNLVTELFHNMLHVEETKIIFARLGKAERREALGHAITKAKINFERKFKKGIERPTTIDIALSSDVVGLQVIDYYLWALQRLYERNDDQFFLPLAKDYRLIKDLDDKRNNAYGEWYRDNNPLTLAKIKPVVS